MLAFGYYQLYLLIIASHFSEVNEIMKCISRSSLVKMLTFLSCSSADGTSDRLWHYLMVIWSPQLTKKNFSIKKKPSNAGDVVKCGRVLWKGFSYMLLNGLVFCQGEMIYMT